MASKKPEVSIVILNYNGKRWLKKCLLSVKKVSYKPFEVILVDNNSSDGSVEYVKNNFQFVKMVVLSSNLGYAKGNNIGAQKARGKYVLFLNNDTTLTPNFLNILIQDMEGDPLIGVIQPQIRSMIKPKLLDSVVSYFTNTGIPYHFGYMKPVKNKKYNKTLVGYSIKGACFMMRKKDYLRLGGLDEDFFIYVEETDLCHRVWLSGKKVVYEPKSYMYHWGGGDTDLFQKTEKAMFLSFRNRTISYLKNFELKTILKIFPLYLFLSEGYIIMALIKGRFKKALGAQSGLLMSFVLFPQILRKRKLVQSMREVSDSDYLKFILKNPSFSYYYYFFSDPQKYKD